MQQPAKAAPARRQRKSDETRRRLLDAGLSVMRERGYENATLSLITERADLGTGTLYLYYRDKRSLYEAIVRRELGRAYKRWQDEESTRPGDGPRDKSPSASLKRLIVVSMGTFAADRQVAQLFLCDGPALENWLVQDIGQAVATILGGDRQQAELAAHLVVGALLAGCRWALAQPEESVSSERLIETVSAYVEAGVAAAASSALPSRRTPRR